MEGFDNFKALEELLNDPAGGDKPPIGPISPTAEMQLKLIRHIIGDSYNKTHVKLITAYEGNGNTGIDGLEKIYNDPSAKVVEKILHWSTTTTHTEDGTISSPCLSILVTYTAHDYKEMLKRLDTHSQRYFVKEKLEDQDLSMLALLVGGMHALSFEIQEASDKLKTEKLIKDLKKLIYDTQEAQNKAKELVEEDEAITPISAGKKKTKKKGSSKKPAEKTVEDVSEKSTGPTKVFQNIDGEGLIVFDQSMLRDVVAEAEKGAVKKDASPEPDISGAENVAKNNKPK